MQECSRQLGEAVKKARLDLCLTQEQAAEKSGTDVRTIINLEQGRGNPKFETLFSLIHALKMDSREVFDADIKLDAPAIRHLRLLIDECGEEEASTLLPIVESILQVIRSKDATKIETMTK